MAANTHSVVRSAAGTQASASFADIINFSSPGDMLNVDNRSASVNLWIRWSTSSDAAATPTSGGDDCLYVPAMAFRSFPIMGVTQVKVIGDAASSSYVVSTT